MTSPYPDVTVDPITSVTVSPSVAFNVYSALEPHNRVFVTVDNVRVPLHGVQLAVEASGANAVKAIKLVRALSGCGLAEARDMVRAVHLANAMNPTT